eukprot:2226952-Pleurochrysis_carterae.AAC.1
MGGGEPGRLRRPGWDSVVAEVRIPRPPVGVPGGTPGAAGHTRRHGHLRPVRAGRPSAEAHD